MKAMFRLIFRMYSEQFKDKVVFPAAVLNAIGYTLAIISAGVYYFAPLEVFITVEMIALSFMATGFSILMRRSSTKPPKILDREIRSSGSEVETAFLSEIGNRWDDLSSRYFYKFKLGGVQPSDAVRWAGIMNRDGLPGNQIEDRVPEFIERGISPRNYWALTSAGIPLETADRFAEESIDAELAKNMIKD